MQAAQILLITTLIISIIFMIVIGVQIYITLTEFRKTLNKFNNIVDNLERVEINVEQGFREFLGFFGGFRTLLTFMEKISNKIAQIREG